MAFKSYQDHSRDNWGLFRGEPNLEQLRYGATVRVADALENLNSILRTESGWCEIRRNLRKLAERPTVTVRHVFRLQFKLDLPWLKSKKRKK